MRRLAPLLCTSLALVAFVPVPGSASSHREAPAILHDPAADATDLYAFRSYEEGREGYVTLIANYNPLQDPFAGPNYYPLDPRALYEIHLDVDGDVHEDVTFRFRPFVENRNLALAVGAPGEKVLVPLPLLNLGPVLDAGDPDLNQERWVEVDVVRNGKAQPLRVPGSGATRFDVPFDNIGEKTFPDYEGYAAQFVHDVQIPGCGPGRMFVGPRKDPFAADLGELFDLVNLAPLFPEDDEFDDLFLKNVTSFVLEIPIACATLGEGPVVGVWTTASLPLTPSPSRRVPDGARRSVRVPVLLDPDPRRQVSRLGNPLVNEVAIGLPDKDAFNASHPADDAVFARYVTHPTLPELLEILFDVEAPNNFPRLDLVHVFLKGLPGVNETAGVGEMLRLNTAFAPAEAFDQSRLGLLDGDLAGFPNGRRPGDDVVDIALRAMMGFLCHAGLGVCDPADAPVGLEEFTDGVFVDSSLFDDVFPYLTTPLPGSPNGEGTT